MDSLRNSDEEDEAMEEDIDSGDEKQAKIRRHLSVCYDKVFESALAILPTSGFIKVVKQLLGRDQPANIQRKALEVLNARFGQKELANPNIPAILQCLARLAMTENKESSNVVNKGKDFSDLHHGLIILRSLLENFLSRQFFNDCAFSHTVLHFICKGLFLLEIILVATLTFEPDFHGDETFF